MERGGLSGPVELLACLFYDIQIHGPKEVCRLEPLIAEKGRPNKHGKQVL